TRWAVHLRYSGIKLFESLADIPSLCPPSQADAPPPGLGALYTGPSGDDNTYTLRASWRSLVDSDDTGALYDSLLADGYFVPNRIPRALFSTLLSSAGAQAIYLGFSFCYYDNGSKSWVTLANGVESQGQQQLATNEVALKTGYLYDLQSDSFVRRPWRRDAAGNTQNADSAFAATVSALSPAERRELGYRSPYAGAPPMRPSDKGGAASWSPVGVHRSFAATIAATADLASEGMTVLDRGILLETRYDDSAAATERLWLRVDASGNHLLRELVSDGSLTELLDAGLAVTGSDPLTLRFTDHGVTRSIVLSGASSLISSLPDSLYEGALSSQLLAGTSFSADSYLHLPASSYEAIDASLAGQTSDQQLFEAAYLPDATGYSLQATVAGSDLEAVVRIVSEAAAASQSLFAALPGDPDAAQRLLALSAAGYGSFSAYTGGSFASDFASYVDGGRIYYYLSPAAVADSASLVAAMRAYRRDIELLLGSYTRSGDSWILAASLSADQKSAVSGALGACGLSAFTSLDKGMVYRADQSIPVEEVVADRSVTCESLAPSPSGAADTVEAGQKVGRSLLPRFDATGRTVLHALYFREYDSTLDYSNRDVWAEAGAEDSGYSPYMTQALVGGMEGWYYGLWSGYYAFSVAQLGAVPSTEGSGQGPPPYSMVLGPNRSQGETSAAVLTVSGRDPSQEGFANAVPVPADALIGPVSSYSDAIMDDNLNTTTREFTFAAFIDGSDLYPSRNGGDTYYRLPANKASTSSQTSLPDIRSSHSSGTDINGGVGLGGLGASFSKNTTSSWEKSAFLDLNGDRYPDLISIKDTKDGASTFSLTPGTGSGFGPIEPWSMPSGCLNETETTAYAFGATIGSGGGATMVKMNGAGRPTAITVVEPDPGKGGGGTGLSYGVNGSFGSSVQTQGFYDMNGDGLPDHVSRGGKGDYAVALNLGNGQFAPERSWGPGIDETIFPLFSIGTEGITDTATGSFGVSGSVTFSAIVASASVSGGFNGTVNRTVSTLADMNGDGLPDVVVKLKDKA
ncbi:MAG TPA: hypothetical protein VMC79_13220, partial [Rectinemataceae bacterium]|nr:hypothetical protein [Rectinemataceae bacterium]